MFLRFINRRPERRPAARILAFSLLALVAGGCDSHEAAAGARGALDLRIVGSSEELYGIEVTVTSVGGTLLPGRPPGRDGRLVLPDAPVGDVRVTIRDPRERFATQTVSLESPGRHELALVPGTHLRATVRGEDGAPLDSGVVVWGGEAAPLAFTLSGPQASFGPLPRGSFKLVVSSPGHETRIVDLNVKRTRTPGTVRDLPDLRLEKGGATLRGKLAIEARHAGLRAFLRYGGAGQEIEVRPDGSFELGGLAVTGGAIEATLVVRDAGRDLLARDLRIAADLDLGRVPLR